MRTRTIVTAAVVAGAAALAVASPAEARSRPKIDITSTSASAVTTAGTAAVTGEIEGRPFGGSFTATLVAADDTLPEPGVCEPATVTFHLDGPGRKFIDADAEGNVCGQWIQPPYVVTQVFTGRYEVVDARRPRLEGTDGFLEVRLADDGRASVFLIDT